MDTRNCTHASLPLTPPNGCTYMHRYRRVTLLSTTTHLFTVIPQMFSELRHVYKTFLHREPRTPSSAPVERVQHSWPGKQRRYHLTYWNRYLCIQDEMQEFSRSVFVPRFLLLPREGLTPRLATPYIPAVPAFTRDAVGALFVFRPSHSRTGGQPADRAGAQEVRRPRERAAASSVAALTDGERSGPIS